MFVLRTSFKKIGSKYFLTLNVFFRFSFAKRSGHVFLKTQDIMIKALSFDYSILKAYFLTYTLISTSTPLGNSSFINASMVFDEEL